VDRKNRGINLSIKALDKADTAAAMQKFAAENTSTAGTTNLGALLKAKLDSSKADAQ
jgi:small subunit ribosomal protein S1